MAPHCFVTTVDVGLADRLKVDLEGQGFILSQPPYTIFAARKTALTCTLYQSGKLTVQGKGMDEFIQFYLEPEILGRFELGYENIDLDLTPRIGVDESGKGDFFGPLCIAGVFAEGETVKQLQAAGVRDSKKLSDGSSLKIAAEIKRLCAHHIVAISPIKYNELYSRFRNLNRLLAWGHATVIEALVPRTHCRHVIVDQFASEHLVEEALERKKITCDLRQRPRAEADLVVAAASILARAAFLEGLERLGKEAEISLPKGGASPQVIKAGKIFIEKQGQESLPQIAKMHFKTLDSIL